MAFSRDFYKTKLCAMYLRGHCPRQSCSFAHGDSELRRSAPGLAARRDFRGGGDLRERLERKHSPRRRFSPGRDGRGRIGHSDRRLSPHDRGHSGSRSPARERSSRSTSPPRDRKRLRIDGPDSHLSDVSGDPRGPTIDADHDCERIGKSPSSSAIDLLEEELRQLHAEIDLLNDQKTLLEASVENKVQEINDITAKNSELNLRLAKEQDDYKRIGSKMKKFVKLYIRYTRAQEEVKKTQARLYKLVEEFPLGDQAKLANHGEDSDVNIVSDGEAEHMMSYPLENGGNQAGAAHVMVKDESNMGTSIPEQSGFMKWTAAARERSRSSKDIGSNQLESGPGSKMAAEVIERSKEQTDKPVQKRLAPWTEKGSLSLASDVSRRFRSSSDEGFADCINLAYEKVKGGGSGTNIPYTGLAAHAEDEELDIVDGENRVDEVSPLRERESLSPNVAEREDFRQNEEFIERELSQMPVHSMQYAEYKGDDEEVDVEAVDESAYDQYKGDDEEVDVEAV